MGSQVGAKKDSKSLSGCSATFTKFAVMYLLTQYLDRKKTAEKSTVKNIIGTCPCVFLNGYTEVPDLSCHHD